MQCRDSRGITHRLKSYGCQGARNAAGALKITLKLQVKDLDFGWIEGSLFIYL